MRDVRQSSGSSVRGTSEPRHSRREALPERNDPSPLLEAAEPKVSSFGVAQSERHARMEALMRRRRQGAGYGQDSPPTAHITHQASSQPPPRARGGSPLGYALQAGVEQEPGASLSAGLSLSPPPSSSSIQGSSEPKAP